MGVLGKYSIPWTIIIRQYWDKLGGKINKITTKPSPRPPFKRKESERKKNTPLKILAGKGWMRKQFEIELWIQYTRTFKSGVFSITNGTVSMAE